MRQEELKHYGFIFEFRRHSWRVTRGLDVVGSGGVRKGEYDGQNRMRRDAVAVATAHFVALRVVNKHQVENQSMNSYTEIMAAQKKVYAEALMEAMKGQPALLRIIGTDIKAVKASDIIMLPKS